MKRLIAATKVAMILCLAALLVCFFSLAFLDDAESQTLEPVGQLKVLDANNTLVGVGVLHRDPQSPEELSVLLKFGEQVFWLGVEGEGFVQPEDLIGFTTPDCTGQPYLFAFQGTSDLLARVAVAVPGFTAYLPVPGAFQEVVAIQSIYDPDFCVPENFIGHAIAAQPVVDLNAQYLPPFRVETNNGAPVIVASVAANAKNKAKNRAKERRERVRGQRAAKR